MYESLAEYYNKYTRDIDYPVLAKFIHNEFSESELFKADSPLVADLACGTGSITLELLRFGYDLIGVDISPEMLDAARNEEYLMTNKNSVLWLCQDMRELDLYGAVCGMVCVTDGVNHITKKKDLDGFFKRVFNFLEYSGIFIFDILTERYFKDVVGNNIYCESDDFESCIWESQYDEKKKEMQYDITLYRAIDIDQNTFLRSDDIVVEKAWTMEELHDSIAKAKLRLKAIYSSVDKTKPTDEDLRRYYICEKVK